MCEANAYIERDGREDLVMEGVFVVKAEPGGKVILENIFGEQRVIEAEISRISLMEHKIIFK
ncbi:MAG: CooT family nickel-binding protein [Deltaproteobacteria bacterium]|nr:CooT family nickel-binding protein [Deltaproteobacteria bacterium]